MRMYVAATYNSFKFYTTVIVTLRISLTDECRIILCQQSLVPQAAG